MPNKENISTTGKIDNKIYVEQLRKLILFFSTIDNPKVRENFLKIFTKITNISKKQNKNQSKNELKSIESFIKICNKADEKNIDYILRFVEYINKINSVVLKDQVIEMVKMMV